MIAHSPHEVYSANLNSPHTLTWRYIELTPNERDLVIYLRRRAAETPDAPIPHLDIIRHIWGPRADADMLPNLYRLVSLANAHLARLGMSERIVGRRGKGYLWAGETL